MTFPYFPLNLCPCFLYHRHRFYHDTTTTGAGTPQVCCCPLLLLLCTLPLCFLGDPRRQQAT